jgi:hypothetical protein
MVQLPRGKGGPQVIVYHWPRNNSVGHVSIQVGDLYLSNVPLPGKGKYLSTRTKVEGYHPDARSGLRREHLSRIEHSRLI